METLRGARSSREAVTGPDPSWSGLYKTGGVLGVLIGVLLILALVLLSTTPPAPSSGGAATLQYIASHRLIYIVEQVIGVAPLFLEMIVFLALYLALKQLNKSAAAIGSVLGLVSQALVLTSLNFGGLVSLSDQYMATTTAAQRAVFANTAQWAIAMNNSVSATGIDVIMTCCAIGVFILSLVMLKGVFHKAVAIFGILTGALGMVSALGIFLNPLPVTPQLGLGYTMYAFFVTIWFVAVGLNLYQLGSSSKPERVAKRLKTQAES